MKKKEEYIYSRRFLYFFTGRISKAYDEVMKHPDLFRTTVQAVIPGALIFSFVFQYTMASVVHPFLQTVWAADFFSFWGIPALISLFVLKLMRTNFNTEAFLEASILAAHPLYVAVWAYFVPSIIYHHFIVGDYPCYVAYSRMGEWVYLALLGVAGFLLTCITWVWCLTKVGRVKWYIAPFIWLFLCVPGLYGTYLIFVWCT